MHRSKHSLFERLEMMKTVKEIEARRESVDARLPIANLFPSVMQYAHEASMRTEEEERLAALSKELFKEKAAASIKMSHRPLSHISNVSELPKYGLLPLLT